MTRDDLLDRVLGKCVPFTAGEWGECDTHHCGWAPEAFEDGRCWKALKTAKVVNRALDLCGEVTEN